MRWVRVVLVTCVVLSLVIGVALALAPHLALPGWAVWPASVLLGTELVALFWWEVRR